MPKKASQLIVCHAEDEQRQLTNDDSDSDDEECIDIKQHEVGCWWIYYIHMLLFTAFVGQWVAYMILIVIQTPPGAYLPVRVILLPVFPRTAVGGTPEPLQINDSGWHNIYVEWVLFAVFVVSSFHHLFVIANWSPLYCRWTRARLAPFKWVEYSITFPLVNIVINSICNGTQFSEHLSIFLLTMFAMGSAGMVEVCVSRWVQTSVQEYKSKIGQIVIGTSSTSIKVSVEAIECIEKESNLLKKQLAVLIHLVGVWLPLGAVWTIIIINWWYTVTVFFFVRASFGVALGLQLLLVVNQTSYLLKGCSFPLYSVVCALCSLGSKSAIAWIVYRGFLFH